MAGTVESLPCTYGPGSGCIVECIFYTNRNKKTKLFDILPYTTYNNDRMASIYMYTNQRHILLLFIGFIS